MAWILSYDLAATSFFPAWLNVVEPIVIGRILVERITAESRYAVKNKMEYVKKPMPRKIRGKG